MYHIIVCNRYNSHVPLITWIIALLTRHNYTVYNFLYENRLGSPTQVKDAVFEIRT